MVKTNLQAHYFDEITLNAESCQTAASTVFVCNVQSKEPDERNAART